MSRFAGAAATIVRLPKQSVSGRLSVYEAGLDDSAGRKLPSRSMNMVSLEPGLRSKESSVLGGAAGLVGGLGDGAALAGGQAAAGIAGSESSCCFS